MLIHRRNPLDLRSASTSGRKRRVSTGSPGTETLFDGGTLSQVGTPTLPFDYRDVESDKYQTETRFCPQGKELFEEEFTFQIQNLRKMDDKLDDDSFFDQLKALNLKPIEKSRPDTQSAFDESRRDVVKFNMTIKATYHQNFVFHNANLCQIAHHQPNLLDHLPSLRMHTQYQPVSSTLLLNLQ
ncbi:hypothetical protein BLNAU_23002 [Blattamonas nauphoetae]|uniref:Uncharacterized protein n=1 Tax=Blattamonas nauphoetae TaxID=2049346 RepID=A0ABQ9WSK8_9EUKA|nr:hypothetical protein BLNAU_23002 [Blattamonas nauphoetae]